MFRDGVTIVEAGNPRITKDFSLNKMSCIFKMDAVNVVFNTEKDNMRPMQNQADAKYMNPNCGKIRTPQWKETKQESGTAGPSNMLGSCLVSFHFLWVILSTSTVL